MNRRAIAYLVAQWTALRPATQRAVREAEGRGCITNAYYFIEVDAAVAREMRDCLRRRTGDPGIDWPWCDSAASVISNRLRVAAYSLPCAGCGRRIPGLHRARRSGRLVLSCARCRWPLSD